MVLLLVSVNYKVTIFIKLKKKSCAHIIQFKNVLEFTVSKTIGIKLWLAPQISEHWPKNKPARWAINLTWFKRPGTASAFTPNDGTVHACKTSAEEIKIRTWILKGTTIRVSTSNSRNIFSSNSLVGIM